MPNGSGFSQEEDFIPIMWVFWSFFGSFSRVNNYENAYLSNTDNKSLR